jgi:probable rRNA maturation factor
MRVNVSDPRSILKDSRKLALRELSLAVVDGREMTRLNRRFTGRTGQTDVLAFPLADAPSPGAPLIGEIVVNASLARREARRRGVRPIHELMLYVVHGALHLAGFDDHRPQDRTAMYSREKEVLRRARIPCTRAVPARRTPARRKHG